ncbi:hypothetical protein [Streptomyces sp. NPDC017529]|uniref:hypothetical protein n=1 Tax=Streptomyces sp. NPDC017529 TaxID=3365000 RepID=UPI00378FCB59
MASDWDVLVALAGAKFSVSVLANGEARFRQELPPEELVESAAARIRPILLEKDPCSHWKALAGLGYFCRSMPHETAWVKEARAEWQARTAAAPARETGYRVMIGDTATGHTADLGDQELAWAWIYGDVVHHDTDRRREADPFGLSERFRAAVPLVAWSMVGTIELLNYIRALQADGVLGLRPDVFDQKVVLETTTWEATGRVFAAPVDTPAPADALTPYDKRWIVISSAADLRRAAG